MDYVISQQFLEHVEFLPCWSMPQMFLDTFHVLIPGCLTWWRTRVSARSIEGSFRHQGEVLWKTSHDVWTSNWHSGDRVVLSVWNIVVQRQKDGPTTWTNSGLLRVEGCRLELYLSLRMIPGPRVLKIREAKWIMNMSDCRAGSKLWIPNRP